MVPSRPRSLRLGLLLALGLLALAPVALTIASCRAVEVGLVEGRLRPCPSSPNCVCSELADDDAAIAPLAFPGEPEEAFRSLLDFLRVEPRAEVVRVEAGYAHLVFRSRIFRFRDDLELRLDPDARVIHVRSASRVGRSDLGVNRARVESIRERWTPPGPSGGAR